MWNHIPTEELYHYGVLGMKWGHRRSQNVGKITKNGKYRASNGIVIGKSKDAGVAAIRRLSTTAVGTALSTVGSVGATKKQKERIKKERAALKEYYKFGGDKMLTVVGKSKADKAISSIGKENINSKRISELKTRGKDKLR